MWENNHDDHDWVDLPGPASWYPENYNYRKHGFFVPMEQNMELFREAFELLLVEADTIPQAFGRVDFASGEFRMMNTHELLFRFIH